MTQSESATATQARTGGAGKKSELQTEHGTTTVADSVVAKIAGIAAREVSGVHAMGTGAARAFGALKEMLPIGSNEPAPMQGVAVEVGETEASVDLDLVVEYGVAIPELAKAVRTNVIQRLERMTGLSVAEVNIAVDDIWLGDDTKGEDEPPRAR